MAMQAHGKRLAAPICAALTMLACGAALAQAWPARPVRLIIGNPPGGSSDLMARALGDELGKVLGQPFVAENVSGASGNVGAERMLQAPADGYAAAVVPFTVFTINAEFYKPVRFEPRAALAPVTLVGVAPLVLAVNPAVPATTLAQLIDWMRSKNGDVSYASQGPTSSGMLAMELLKMTARVQATHVPYKGSGPAVADVVAGHVPMLFDNTTSALPQVRRGSLRAIAVAEKKRIASAPEIPTMDEAGMPGFEATPWFGMTMRAGTPREVVERISAESVRILAQPALRARFDPLGVELRGMAPDEFQRYIDTEAEKWSRLVRTAGIKAN